MRIEIPCTLSLELDVAAFRAAVEAELAAVRPAVDHGARGAPLRKINAQRRADRDARTAAASDAVLASLSEGPQILAELSVALSRRYGQRPFRAAVAALLERGAIVRDARGVYSLPSAGA